MDTYDAIVAGAEPAGFSGAEKPARGLKMIHTGKEILTRDKPCGLMFCQPVRHAAGIYGADA